MSAFLWGLQHVNRARRQRTVRALRRSRIVITIATSRRLSRIVMAKRGLPVAMCMHRRSLRGITHTR